MFNQYLERILRTLYYNRSSYWDVVERAPNRANYLA